MPRCHPDYPRRWLMTDERMGDDLWRVLARLPRGTGVVFRHYGLAKPARAELFARVARIARARRLVLVVAGADRLGGACGRHGRDPRRMRGLRTWPAHDAREVIAGRRAGADLLFVSPLFATASHPGARPLGVVRAATLARLAPGRAIALGGVGPQHERRMAAAGFVGWAAIDAWRG